MQKMLARTAAQLIARVVPAVQADASCGSFTRSCGCLSYNGKKYYAYRTCYACSDGSTTCNNFCWASSSKC